MTTGRTQGLLCVLLAITLWTHRRKKQIKSKIDIRGQVASEFQPVKRAFQKNFEECREVGAQLCCYVNGVKVVDLTGARDVDSHIDLAVVFSSTKVIESLVVAVLVDRNLLDYGDSVAKYWPEFANCVSPTVTIADLMRHQAGVSSLNPLPTRDQLREMFVSMEYQKKFLEKNTCEYTPTCPASEQSYHALTRGMYVDVIVHAVTGKRVSDYFRDELLPALKQPNFEIDFEIGCSEANQHRVAVLEMIESRISVGFRFVAQSMLPSWMIRYFYADIDILKPFEMELIRNIASPHVVRTLSLLANELPSSLVANDPFIRSLPLCSAFGVTNAFSLATIGSDLVTTSGLLSKSGFEKAVHVSSPPIKDSILFRTLALSDCGWGMNRFDEFGANGYIGWAGVGGSLFVFHRQSKSSFAYIPNGLEARLYKAKGVRLLQAFEKCIQNL